MSSATAMMKHTGGVAEYRYILGVAWNSGVQIYLDVTWSSGIREYLLLEISKELSLHLGLDVILPFSGINFIQILYLTGTPKSSLAFRSVMAGKRSKDTLFRRGGAEYVYE
jgi:hypothetical protein